MASVTGIVTDIHGQVTDVPNSSSAVPLVIVKSSPSSELALYSPVDLLCGMKGASVPPVSDFLFDCVFFLFFPCQLSRDKVPP